MKIKLLFLIPFLFGVILISSGFIFYNIPDKPKVNHAKSVIAESIEKISFAKFLSHFDKIELPFERDLETMQYDLKELKIQKRKNYNNKKSLNNIPDLRRTNYIPELSTNIISRMGPPQIIPVGRFYPNENSVAVIYTSRQSFAYSYVDITMVVYDLSGNIIFPAKDEKDLYHYSGFSLAHSNPKSIYTCQIDPSGKITRKKYENKWKKDYREHGFDKNEIISRTMVANETYTFNPKGILEKHTSPQKVQLASIN